MSPTLLLEIGVEEIPARFLPDAIQSLAQSCETTLRENSIGYSNIKTYATPRRLAVFVEGIPLMQKDSVREVFGPPKKVALNEDGSFTKAGQKFAESQGVSADKLIIKKKDKGEYVSAIVEEKGMAVKNVLPEAIKKIILSMNFPKSMRWGDGSLRFVRPIRWIMAMLNSEVIEFEIDGIRSSNITYGHRFLSPSPIEIKDINKYESLLKRNFVIPDPSKREEMINKQVRELTGISVMDEELLKTVTYLVEYPQAVLGSFPKEYLSLPDELIESVLKGHQKYFSIKDKGKLKNQFIVISNTTKENDDTIRLGAERVIKARLEDARFYYDEDRKKPLIERVEDLKRVTYQEKLGSLYDKTMRVKTISGFIADRLKINRDNAERAALLSKTDLITGVVREFPELQGVMGYYYALGDNEDFDVQFAIRDQYRPLHYGDYIPKNDTGAILSLADKMDNISSFFSIGLKPTGSEDPFALRRASIGVIMILLDKEYRISIGEVLEKSVSNISHVKELEPIIGEISEFFEVRIENHLLGIYAKNYSPDVIQSILHMSTALPLIDIKKRMGALMGFKSAPEYSDFLLAIKRVRNIIPKREMPSPKLELFREEEEKMLFKVLMNVKEERDRFIDAGSYKDALRVILELTQPINNFFDKVLVMDKDESIRQNRLSLLMELWNMVSELADFSALTEKD
ncbi:MAG: glycine--tRNA ligase subunit beta [Nitrospirae bacterium]|nr:glycine--tRNA ligase subunit beta [Nitrospirota bacterium]